MKNQNHQQGISLYLAFILMTILFTVAFGISAILISEIKIIKSMGNSVIAFYAADTGIEKVLIDRGSPDLTPDYYSGSLGNGADYEVNITIPPECAAVNYCIKSVGIYKETRRAIEIGY